MANPEDSEDDEELKLAIALSLQESAQNSKDKDKQLPKNAVIDLCDGTDDSPSVVLARAMESKRTETAASKEAGGELATKSSGFLGLDRKAMEEERLARAQKLKTTNTTSAPLPVSLKRNAEDTQLELPSDAGQRKRSTPGPTNTSTPCSQPQRQKAASSVQFPNGVIKKTWADGFPREGDDIKIEEVLQRSDLQLAVLSSFQWDVSWIMSKVDTNSTKMIFVMQAKDEATKVQYRQETADMPNLRLCFPPMAGNVNCMHSKLMLLSHPDYLRVAVPTANLVQYDWGETGTMENSVFVIDLPRLMRKEDSDKDRGNEDNLTDFGKELKYFCIAMGLQKEVVDSIHKFDFAATKHLAFVHSIGGEHTSEDAWHRTGYCGLGRAVSSLGLGTQDALRVDFVASSIGAIGVDFLTVLYLAAQGDDGRTEYGWRYKPKTSKGADRASDERAEQAQLEVNAAVTADFKVYFPSHETVRRSKGGTRAGGVICFQKRWYESSKFPKWILLDCQSSRKGLLMHNKLLYVQPMSSGISSPPSASSSPSRSRPWLYVGSANCSESAWGRLVQAKGSKKPKMTCRNWECGVVVPVRRALGEDDSHFPSSFSPAAPLAVFKGTAPVPMQCPAEQMGHKTPWFFMD